MLNYLRIRDLAVIDDVELELGDGLTVLTGETGAGKSIIFDGLSLVLGERASLGQVRAGAERAVVEAVFRCDRDPTLTELLEERDLAGDEAGQLVVRRVVTASGSRHYVNDHPVGLKLLRELGDRLVDLHGQHEHQSLLSASAHRDLLDRFAGAGELRQPVAAAHDRAVALQERLDGLQLDERDRVQRQDLLRFQLREIESAELQEGEDDECEAELRRLAHAEELAEAGAEAVALLYEDEGSAAARIARAVRRLERLAQLDPGAPAGVEVLEGARLELEEASRSLQAYLDDLQVDPRRLAAVEERLAVIERLRRKYGDSVQAVLEHADACRRELESLEHHDEEIVALAGELETAVAAYAEAAGHLSRRRREAAAALEGEVQEELAGLAMEGARFEVAVRPRGGEARGALPAGASRHGSDRVEFLLAANPGEGPGPLSRVASGGELSRVMLALKLTATDGDPLETLLFDEVDSGVGGGRVAERLAQRLAALARTHQVLVVTHLPQVAAYADNHVGVRKVEVAGRVLVEARRLDEDEQIDELARMLGGLEITEATRRHARELLAARR